MRRILWAIGNVLVAVAVLIGGYFAITNAQGFVDWWRLRTYTPPAEIARIADITTMQGAGRDLFYISQPEIQDRDAFNQSCTDHGEQSLVLGCYKLLKIYIYNVTDPRLAGVQEVTAAHEMLHAAYQRLGVAEKSQVNQWLQAQMNSMNDERLQNLIRLYNQEEPGELLNEMHSILATEYASLSPELDNYYKRFFADRTKVVAFAQQYESVFTASKLQLATLDSQLDGLRRQVEANNAELERRQSQLEATSERLDTLRGQDIAAYNQAVGPYNQQVREFNMLANLTRRLVEQYNALVTQRNSEAAAQNDLYNSLDSNYAPVPAT